MSKAAYRASLERRLAKLDSDLEHARDKLERGTPQDHVLAAGELKVIEDERHQVEQRIAALDKEPEGSWEDFRTSVDDAVDEVAASVRRWIDRH
ncbi:MAG: hypothetical protein GVY13_05910 [Alphaproteobacteria bacterium]|jgi:hypothetical protein|nr:hypothetical protein [Alphaproteobacteria bacterium]